MFESEGALGTHDMPKSVTISTTGNSAALVPNVNRGWYLLEMDSRLF